MSLSLVLNDPSVCKTLAFKTPLRCLDWANLAGKGEEDSRKAFSHSTSLLSWMDLPKKCVKFERSIASLGNFDTFGELVEKIVNVFKKFTSVLGLLTSALQIAVEDGILILTRKQIDILDATGFVSSLALTMYSALGMKKRRCVLTASNKEGYDLAIYILKTVAKICSLATGIFGMISYAYGGGLHAKWALLVVSTVSLSTSIIKYYFKSLHSNA
jgi:hypothetical protein